MATTIINASKNIKSVDTNFNGGLSTPIAVPNGVTSNPVFCATQAGDATLECHTLNCTKKGNNSYERNGNQIKLKSYNLVGSLQVSSTVNVLPGAYIRVIIVWDSQPNKTSAKFVDVFKGTQTDGTAFTDIFTQPNVSNKKRFKILRDIKEQLGAIYTQTTPVAGNNVSTIISSSPSFITLGEYKAGKELFSMTETVYENNSAAGEEGTYKAITTGALLIFTLTNACTVTPKVPPTDPPTYNYTPIVNANWTVRVTYEDK